MSSPVYPAAQHHMLSRAAAHWLTTSRASFSLVSWTTHGGGSYSERDALGRESSGQCIVCLVQRWAELHQGKYSERDRLRKRLSSIDWWQDVNFHSIINHHQSIWCTGQKLHHQLSPTSHMPCLNPTFQGRVLILKMMDTDGLMRQLRENLVNT